MSATSDPGHDRPIRALQDGRGSLMIEVLQDMPQGVAGIRVSGRVRGDYLRAFKPTWKTC